MMQYVYIGMVAAAMALCLKGPKWGVAAMAFLLPLSKRLPSLPIPLLNTQNLIVLMALAAFFLRPADNPRQGRAGAIRFAVPLGAFTLLAAIAYGNSMLFFEPPRYAFAWEPYTVTIIFKNLLTCLLIYALGCLVARNREGLDVALKGLAAGMAFEAAFVCAEVVMRGPARANGHLYEGNSAGAYLAGALAAALGMALMLGWRTAKGRLYLGTTIASAIGLIFTMSRGNWFGGILAGVAIAFLKDRRLMILMIVGVMLYPLWLPQKAMDRIQESFIPADQQGWRFTTKSDTDEAASIIGLQERLMGEDGSERGGSELVLDSSSQVRLYVWQAGVRMIQDYPLGVGFGAFPFYLHMYSDIIRFRAAHNSYLQITAELGIPAISCFLCFLGCLLFESWMAFRKAGDPVLRGLGLAAFGTTIAMMVSGVFYNFFFIIEVNGQQWLILGMAMQARRLAEVIPRPDASAQPAADGPVPLYRLVS